MGGMNERADVPITKKKLKKKRKARLRKRRAARRGKK